MREKLLFVGMLIMSVLYCVEVVPKRNYDYANYLGFAIAAVTIIPWLVSLGLAYRRRSKEKLIQQAVSNYKKNQAEKQ